MNWNASTHTPGADPALARKTFLWTLALTFLVKLWLAYAFPMTGDEAFFYQWGVHPDWGYYDHPPMIGWILFLLNSISGHPLGLRLVTVLMWSIVALGLVDLMRRTAPEREADAYWVGSLFLVLPFAWMMNLVTSDTPLILFVFASGYSFIRARLEQRTLWYAAAGAFLGLALLSKYFAVLLSVVYFVYLVRNPRDWPKLLLIAVCALPFAALNVAYNVNDCWSNIMFNLVNRHDDADWGLGTVFGYLLMMVYLITPWVVISLARRWKDMPRFGAVVVLFAVPFMLFLLLSTHKTIGLHWVLAFMPFVFLFAGLALGTVDLRRYFRWTVWFSMPHLLIVAVVIFLPTSMLQDTKMLRDVVFHKHTGEIVAALRDGMPEDGRIMARAYTPASLLSFHAGEYLPVFGTGRFHARQDDIIVDFRDYDGKTLRIFNRSAFNLDEAERYLDDVTLHSFDVRGWTFYYAEGSNFNYGAYREGVLQEMADRFYQIPSMLPVCGCRFLERYELTPR